jgi:site-specific recombinase XerC
MRMETTRDIDAFSFSEWRSQQSLSPKTLNEYLSVLNQFMEWLVDNAFLETNPIAKVKRVKVRGRATFARRAFTMDEITRLLNALDTPSASRSCGTSIRATG